LISELEQSTDTNWNKISLNLLSTSLNDWRLNSFFIDLVSVDYALAIVDFVAEEKKEYYNAVSTTSAFGWSSLMSSFGDTRVNWESLLPVKSEQVTTVKEGYKQPTERTIKIIKRLLEQGRLSYRVQAAIIATGCLK